MCLDVASVSPAVSAIPDAAYFLLGSSVIARIRGLTRTPQPEDIRLHIEI